VHYTHNPHGDKNTSVQQTSTQHVHNIYHYYDITSAAAYMQHWAY